MKLPFSRTFNEKPILFNTEMVKAILEGRKTQTRRVIKMQPLFFETSPNGSITANKNDEYKAILNHVGYKIRCPYGKPGDRLWVRETYAPDYFDERYEYKNNNAYKAEWIKGGNEPKWKPSIFMPRAAARIFLEITDIRVERVQDITRQDAVTEGIEYYTEGAEWGGAHEFSGYKNYQDKQIDRDGDRLDEWFSHPVDSFHSLWDSINEKRGFGWDINPWVWVVEFKRIEMPLSEKQQISEMQQDCYDNCEI